MNTILDYSRCTIPDIMKTMKAVIFDMDGVIIDSEPLHFRLEKRMFTELGISLTDREHEGFLGTSSHEMFSRLKEKFGLDRSVNDLVNEERRRYLAKLNEESIPVIPGIPELVSVLSGAGMILAVASSAPHEQIDLVMNESAPDGGLGRFFQIRVSGDDVARGKPDPAIFLKTAELLEVAPEDSWVIEDSENGIKAALSAGMSCIAFKNPTSGPQNLSGANHRISRINEAFELILG